MHILFLDQYFRPPDGSGNTRSYEIARRWVQSGHEVTIVTSAADLPDTYGVGQFTLDGIQLSVARAPRDKPAGLFRRLLRSIQFTMAAIWRTLHVSDVDVVFVTSLSRAAMIPGVISGVAKAAPIVIAVPDYQGLVPGVRRTIRQSIAWRAARAMDRIAYRTAQRIVAHEPGVKEGLVAEGIDESKIAVVPDGCDTALFRVPADHGVGLLETYPHLKGGPLVIYSGSLEPEKAIGYLVDVATATLSIDPAIRFVICGDGPARDDVRTRAKHAGVFEQNLWMLPALPRQRMPELLSVADAATSLFPPLRDGQHKSFSEVFDVLAADKPLISNHGGWHADLIESRGAGIKVSADDMDSAARDIADFVKDSEALRRASEQAAALADSRFNRDKLTNELRTVVEAAAVDDPALARRRRRSLALKRVVDVALAFTALIALSPIMIAVALIILFRMGQPVVFAHRRPGLGGQPFRLLKFRTMDDATDSSGTVLPDGDRMTSLGRILRRTSLDELPELINVLIGDMSLVGPRPLMMEYLPYYDQNQARRHTVRPGITGWAQINGRNALTWEEKFDLDCWYVDNRTLWLDLKILLRTAWVVITGKGVAAPGHDSMPRFDEIMARRQGAEDI
ncbi:MAG: glycosyltransferase [Alphaproteobacteria bacterium]|nr:glycosyltransferase [Alphaproteobacteria bacterium]